MVSKAASIQCPRLEVLNLSFYGFAFTKVMYTDDANPRGDGQGALAGRDEFHINLL
jgi:hypothetical protein